MNNEMVPVSQKIAKLRTELEEKRETVFKAAAEHIKPDRFMEQVARACITNPKLLDCNRSTLFMAAAQAASLGLEIGGPLGHAYIVPYGRDATLVPGYLGLKELAYRSGMIADIETAAVYKDDEFEWQKGTSKFIRHKPSDSSVAATPTHVYAIVHTTTGGTMFDVMSWAQVEWHRNKFSKGHTRSDSSWMTNPTAMGLKTVLRKVLKLCPLSAELQRLMQQEEYAEADTGFTSGEEAPPSDLDAAAKLIAGDGTQVEPEPFFSEDGSLSPEEQQALFTQQGIPF